MKAKILTQINNLTRLLVEYSICVAQNFPIISDNQVVWQNYKDISFVLSDQKYEVIYEECLKEKAFNMVLIDGAIIQLMYAFAGNKLSKQRLAFFPNPHLEKYQDYPENYEEMFYGSSLFSEIRSEKYVASPIRFDYSNEVDKFKEFDHPYSHLTIGNYKSCRIAATSPISPYVFIRFILKNFYFDKFKECLSEDNFKCDLRMEPTITKNEAKKLHFHFNH